MGVLLGIATRPVKKAPMEELVSAAVTFEKGVAEDSRGKFRNHRQVTVISSEVWNKVCTEMNKSMPWTTRRANLLVEGIDLEKTTGNRLHFGSCVLEITGELEPCNRMDHQYMGLTNALKDDWRGGVTCKIIQEGKIALGDKVSLETN